MKSVRAGRTALCGALGVLFTFGPIAAAHAAPEDTASRVATPRLDAVSVGDSVTDPGLRLAFLAGVQASAGSAFAFTATDDARTLDADNPAHGFAATVSADGYVHVRSPGESWAFSMRLASFGRTGSTYAVGAPERTGVRNGRAELARGHGVREWYANGALGLEQGFTLTERPAGTGDVQLAFTTTGLAPRVEGRVLALVDATGVPRLRHVALLVVDADGREVPAALVEHDAGFAITIDDARARYPLVVDPFTATSEQAVRSAPVVANARFGTSVAIEGNVAVIGAVGETVGGFANAGAVYVFRRTAGVWAQEQRLVTPNPSTLGQFGTSVAICNGRIYIGAPTEGSGGRGRVYVAQFVDPTWVFAGVPVISGTADDQRVGTSVACDGDDVVVGAPGYVIDDQNDDDLGAVYAFSCTSAVCAANGSVLGPYLINGAAFGTSVSLSGTRLVVGAPGANEVRAYTVGAGLTAAGTITPPVGSVQVGSRFGSAVDISGGYVIVGAPSYFDVVANAGRAFFYRIQGASWVSDGGIATEHATMGGSFGSSVAIDANDAKALIGAPSEAFGGVNSTFGATYLVERDAGAWVSRGTLPRMSTNHNGRFGASVALAGLDVLVGQPTSPSFEGFAHFYRLELANGTPCATAPECASDSCVDGVCCGDACGGGQLDDCIACSIANGSSAAADGVCAPRLMGLSCNDQLACSTTSECNASGMCEPTPGMCDAGVPPTDGSMPTDGSTTDGATDATTTDDGGDSDAALAGVPQQVTGCACDAAGSSRAPTTLPIAATALVALFALGRVRRRQPRRIGGLVALALLAQVLCATASAQDLEAEARAHFQLGATYYSNGRFQQAGDEFEEAYRLSQRPRLLYNIFVARRDQGDDVRAAAALRAYLAADLEIDDRALLESRLVALDRQIAERAARPAETEAEPQAPEPITTAPPESSATEQPSEGRSLALPIALMSGGGVSLAASGLFALLAKNAFDDLEAQCGPAVGLPEGRCPTDFDQGPLSDRVERNRLLGWTFLGVGTAALGAGIVTLLVGGEDDTSASTTVVPYAACSGTGCLVGAGGSF